MIKVDQALRGVSRLGLDTAGFIYLIDEDPKRLRAVQSVFRRIERGRIDGVTSIISLTEVLTGAIRAARNDLETRYRELLLNSENLISSPVSEAIAASAAKLRATYNITTPDAIQLATALEFGCQAFLTNDNRLRSVAELRVIIIDDLEV